MCAVNLKMKNFPGLGEGEESRFFGSPLLPKKISEKKFEKEVMFVGQLNLSELKPFDKDDLLPDVGFIYIFYDTYLCSYELYYSKEVPTFLKEDFNKGLHYGRYDKPLSVEFSFDNGEDDESFFAAKMLSEPPQKLVDIKKAYKKYLVFICISREHLEKLDKQYLLKAKTSSYILIKRNKLKKGKLSGVITVND